MEQDSLSCFHDQGVFKHSQVVEMEVVMDFSISVGRDKVSDIVEGHLSTQFHQGP